jgi:hypothetical protein
MEACRRPLKALRAGAPAAESSDHAFVSLDERGHPSMTFRSFSGLFQQPNLVALGVVQVGDATVRSICGRAEEFGPAKAQRFVDDGEVLDPEYEEPLRSLPTLPRRTPMDREADGSCVKMNHVAFVEEEWQAEDVSVERPRPIQILRIQDHAFDGQHHFLPSPSSRGEAAVISFPPVRAGVQGTFAVPFVIVK